MEQNKVIIICATLLALAVLLGIFAVSFSRNATAPATTEHRPRVRLSPARRPPQNWMPSPWERQSIPPASEQPTSGNAAAPTNSSLATVKVRTFTAETTATLRSGETLVMGGWPAAGGKSTWAFITPDTAGTQTGQIIVRSHINVLPEESVAHPAWQALKAKGDQNNATGVLAPGDLKALTEWWADKSGVDQLSAPTIVTLDGQEATFQVGQELVTNATSGATQFVGIRLKVQPTTDSSHGTIEMDVSAEVSDRED